MPNRLIREALLTSWRYERLSNDAKLFYFHLLLSADDVGCLELGPTFLRRRVLFSQDSDERLAKLINELADVDLLRPYQHDGRCFGFIPRFRQRLQIKRMKCPYPPEQLIADDEDAKEKIQKIKELSTKTTVGHRLPNRCPTVAQPSEPEPEPEPEVRTKPSPSTDGQVIWELGLTLLKDQNVKEATARTFLAGLLKSWSETDVAEAIRLAVGKGEVKSYIMALLSRRPKKDVPAIPRER